MVVHDFDVVRIFALPFKADTVLVIDTNAVLPFSITFQSLQSEAGKGEIPKGRSRIEELQADPGRSLNGLKLLAEPALQQLLRLLVSAGADHYDKCITRCV